MPVERPTFSESWYRVADMRPRLRPTIQTHRQHFRGQMWHVVQDPSNNQFSRLSDPAYRFVALLDGRRTVGDCWKICNEQLGDGAPTQGEVIQLLGQLYVSNLLLSEVPPDVESLFQRYKKRIQREVQGYLMNLLFIRIPLIDPDAFLNRWVGLFGKCFSPVGLMALAALVVAALYCVRGMAGELFSYSRAMGMHTGTEGILSTANLPILYACFVLTKVLHEFGHAFACKRFGRQEGSGGEVHVMGVMFLVFTPFPYVDASSSWAFRSKWRRVIVGAAGVLVELAIASVAAIVYSQAADQSLVAKVCYNIIFIAGVSTILFNGNPLLRYDGYYILSDLLEIPNLAQRSKQYMYYLVRKYAWGVRNVRSPAHTGGERVWMIVYGIASTIYRVFICAAILLFVADQLFLLGAVLAVAAVVAWVCVPLGKFLHYLATSSELMRVRPRAIGTVLGTVLVLGALLGGVPFPERYRLEGIVMPLKQQIVYAQGDGFVTEVLASGTAVGPEGPPLLLAENRDLELQKAQLDAEMERLQADRNQALQDITQISNRQQTDADIVMVKGYLQYIDRKLAHLRVYSTLSGTWISPECDRLKGAYMHEGDAIGQVADLSEMEIAAFAPQDVPHNDLRKAVEIRIEGRPPRFQAGALVGGGLKDEQHGRITGIDKSASQQLPSPALSYAAGGRIETDPSDKDNIKAVEPLFKVRVAPDDSSRFRIGQRVEVRVRRPDRPLAAQWWHALEQLIQRRFRT